MKMVQFVVRIKTDRIPQDFFSLLLSLFVLATIAGWQLWPAKSVFLYEKQITLKNVLNSLSETINNIFQFDSILQMNYCYSRY